MATVKSNDFVKRQTKASRFAHFEGSWEQLEKMVETNLVAAKPGYKPGVILIPLPAEGFFSSVTKVGKYSHLFASFAARTPHEDAVINVTANGEKVPAKSVKIVLYTREVLLENGEASTTADFEIVSINASPIENMDTPMDPTTMMRNHLGLPGGTKGTFSGDDFANSILFWSQHALVKEQ